MPRFSYQARTAEGKIVSGTLESADRVSAVRLLEQDRFFPTKVEIAGAELAHPTMLQGKGISRFATITPRGIASAATASPARSVIPPTSLRLSHAQRLTFTEQLAYLLSVGMTLDEALGILSRRLKQPALQGVTRSLHQALVDGSSFSQALRSHPRIFSPLYANLVQAGEASGSLPSVLTRLVQHLTEMKAMRDRVQQALIYPAMLAVVGVALVIVFVTVMVPQISSLLSQSGHGATLPLPTRLLISSHAFIVRYWWLGLTMIAGTFALFRLVTSQPAGRLWWDRVRLKIPGFGQVLSYRFFVQFARTLSTLLNNGVALLRAMELLEDIAGNRFVQTRMSAARSALVEGATLSKALGQQALFPELYLDMVAVGEQSGRFGETMAMVADVYERELDRRVKIASAVIPPIIIVIIALLVGAVVFGILSAVFSLTSGMRSGMG
ncbi:MAG: type II secretion system F family protein [Verrucomicrobia bacterium]|nr:type II secretion system F family protein [Verrucomicrobiota bacterium]